MDEIVAKMGMGNYGAYVWSAYGIALFILGALFISVRIKTKRVIRTLNRLHKPDFDE